MVTPAMQQQAPVIYGPNGEVARWNGSEYIVETAPASPAAPTGVPGLIPMQTPADQRAAEDRAYRRERDSLTDAREERRLALAEQAAGVRGNRYQNKFDEARATRDAARFGQALEGWSAASGLETGASRAERLLESGAPVGAFADQRIAAGRIAGDWLGFLPGIPTRQETQQLEQLRLIGSQGALGDVAQLKGPLSEKELAFIQRLQIDPNATRETNLKVAEAMKWAAQRQAAYGESMQDWVRAYGSPSDVNEQGLSFDAWWAGHAAENLPFPEEGVGPLPPASRTVERVASRVFDGAEIIERDGQPFYRVGLNPGEGAPADLVTRYGGDGQITADEMLAAGYVPDQDSGQWLFPVDMSSLPPDGGGSPPPAGPQGGSPAPTGGSDGYRTALEQERQSAQMLDRAGAGYGITDALTGEFNDELAFGAGYLTQGLGNIGRRLTGRPIEVSAAERARAARDVMVENREDFARERPAQNVLGNVLGGAAFGPQGAARTMLGRAAQGAGMGATYGMAGAEGNVVERIPSALTGGAIGAAATPAVEKLAAPAVNALARPVAEGIQTAGRFSSRITGRIGNALGVPGAERMIAANQPNPLASGINRFARRSPQDVNALNANVQRFRAEEIEPTFVDAINDGGRGTMRALATRQTPARQQAREFAESRAAGLQDRVSTQGRRIISDDPRQPREIRDEAIARGRGRAAPLYDEAYARPGSPRSPLTDELMQRPSMREALARANRIAREEGRDPTTLGFEFDEAGNVLHVREPSMQTMDYIKRGLDDYLESFRDPVTGRLNLDTAGRAAQGTRESFRRELRRLNPKYGEALDAYADEAQMTEAVDIGERFLSMDAADFATAVNRLSPEQREVARAAARRAVERQAGTQGQAPGVAQRLSNGREQAARSQALLGDDAPRLQEAMGTELQALRNAQAVSPAQGSPTSMNAQDAMNAAGLIRDTATLNLPNLAGRAMNAIRSRGFSDQEAEAIVQAAIDPAQTDQLISMLAERMTRREARNLARAIRYQITTSLPANQ